MQLADQSSSNLERWSSTIRDVCGPFRTEPTGNDSLFIGDVSACEKAGLTLAHMRTNAGCISREYRSGDMVDDRYCFLVSQRRGASTITQNGIDIELSPGDVVLMDSVGSCRIRPHGLMEHASLHLPRKAIHERLSRGALFGKVSLHCASGRILHSMFDELCNNIRSGERSDDEQDAIVAACTSLLGPSLTAEVNNGLSVDGLTGTSLRRYTERLIEESLASPRLSPAMLADKLEISVRHLYRLFEEDGDSVCRYIQRSRLRKSANDLANPRFKHETITSIAYRWGFSDSAHFSRSFKKEFQHSPREYRTEALGI